MTGLLWAVGIVVAFVAVLLIASRPSAVAAQEERDRVSAERQARLVCRHCRAVGQVTSQVVRRKRGISGGKATGAVLTAGVSMLATGLSRKQTVTHMTCSSCGTGWDVD